MADAICVSCGAPKDVPWKVCASCGLDPQADESNLVKSVYLSTGRFESTEEIEDYRLELDDISRAIVEGHDFEFDVIELERLTAQRRLVEEVPMNAVWNALFRLFLPGFVFIAFLLGLLFLIRFLRAP